MALQYCPKCMKLLPSVQKCLYCGFDSENYVQPRNSLAPGTMVENCRVGIVLASSRQSFCYSAYDSQTGNNVLLEEFYPAAAVRRDGNNVVQNKPEANFPDACLIFKEAKEKQRGFELERVFEANKTVYRIYRLSGEQKEPEEQADKLLDTPLRLRNAKGRPVYAINAMPIVPMPKERLYRDCRNGKRGNRKLYMIIGAAVLCLALAALYMFVLHPVITGEPLALFATATLAPTDTPTPTLIITPTPMPTSTPTPTPEPTPTPTPTPVPTEVPDFIPDATVVPMPVKETMTNSIVRNTPVVQTATPKPVQTPAPQNSKRGTIGITPTDAPAVTQEPEFRQPVHTAVIIPSVVYDEPAGTEGSAMTVDTAASANHENANLKIVTETPAEATQAPVEQSTTGSVVTTAPDATVTEEPTEPVETAVVTEVPATTSTPEPAETPEPGTEVTEEKNETDGTAADQQEMAETPAQTPDEGKSSEENGNESGDPEQSAQPQTGENNPNLPTSGLNEIDKNMKDFYSIKDAVGETTETANSDLPQDTAPTEREKRRGKVDEWSFGNWQVASQKPDTEETYFVYILKKGSLTVKGTYIADVTLEITTDEDMKFENVLYSQTFEPKAEDYYEICLTLTNADGNKMLFDMRTKYRRRIRVTYTDENEVEYFPKDPDQSSNDRSHKEVFDYIDIIGH